MAQQQSRSILAMIFRNFINSLKPRQVSGDLKGTDYFGNKYFEIPANPSVGKRRASRWFEPQEKENFQQEMPAEWEAWLRHRRTEPPTQEEVERNYALMQMKKAKAIEIDKKGGVPAPITKGMETFPKRPDMELTPGQEMKQQ
ncbi:NADH ubiquinone oxidoreductase subunit NDUFA12 [Popillia japonica]|uniref:NADH ubiquinone oxidoreductase subunit NDUFA12 n=1 Tax=Popillia japonica TaxID=7064 RepID=A0AAW1L6Y2_POPJA